MILGWTEGTRAINGFVWGGSVETTTSVGSPFGRAVISVAKTLLASTIEKRTLALARGESTTMSASAGIRGTLAVGLSEARTLVSSLTKKRTFELVVAERGTLLAATGSRRTLVSNANHTRTMAASVSTERSSSSTLTSGRTFVVTRKEST